MIMMISNKLSSKTGSKIIIMELQHMICWERNKENVKFRGLVIY